MRHSSCSANQVGEGRTYQNSVSSELRYETVALHPLTRMRMLIEMAGARLVRSH